MLKIGEVNELQVLKETDIAYTLTDGEITVFLHFNQTPRHLSIGETVLAFLYYDQKKRLCATLENPLVTTKKGGFTKVVALNDAGVFVNIGISKDILLSKDYLPNSLKLWPRVGEEIPVILKVKATSIIAKPLDFSSYNNATMLPIGSEATGIVSAISNQGISLWTKDMAFIYINKALTRTNFHLGEEISCHIISQKDNINYGSMIEQKEKMLVNDSDIILSYLKEMGGILKLGNNATPEDINKTFHMSKSAYKRAIGHLYKYHLIEIHDDYIELINK